MTEMITVTLAEPASRFSVRFARNEAEVVASQKLRYRIFAGELGAAIDGGTEGLDVDQYDAHCQHLLVIDNASGEIIACTRILTEAASEATGGFYSASEFDLEMIHSLPGRVMEIGRTCVAAEHRSGAVIATLWQGIAEYITREGYDYMFGCASIGLEDGGAAAHQILDTLRGKHMSDVGQRVTPYYGLPVADKKLAGSVRMPPLLKAYVSLGAKACGEAYWDRDFNCADVFMLLNVSDLNPRYARHFLARNVAAVADERSVALAQ